MKWLLKAALAGLLAGAAISVLKLRFHCREPVSEACVWGKAYFPLAFPLETLVFGGLAFALLLIGRWFLGRRERQ